LPRGPRLGGWWATALATLVWLLLVAAGLNGVPPKASSGVGGRARSELTFSASLGWGLRRLALVGVLAMLLAAGLGCGGGGGNSGGGGTTSPPESGSVTITGSSGNTSHTAQVSVNVS
jgi:hypothetical protein